MRRISELENRVAELEEDNKKLRGELFMIVAEGNEGISLLSYHVLNPIKGGLERLWRDTKNNSKYIKKILNYLELTTEYLPTVKAGEFKLVKKGKTK